MKVQRPEVSPSASAESGRTWSAIDTAVAFERPAPLFDQPMEISVQMLRGLRMVDETIVVLGDLLHSADKSGELP